MTNQEWAAREAARKAEHDAYWAKRKADDEAYYAKKKAEDAEILRRRAEKR